MADRRWVTDTTAYTHLCRAGHATIIERLAPNGVVVVPSEVSVEIERARDLHAGIPSVGAVAWAELTVLNDAETWTALEVKAQLSGGPLEHLGECAVIACAHHRGYIAIVDDSAAVAQADRLGVTARGTLWIVAEAYRRFLDRPATEQVVEDLLSTDMYLPVSSGKEFFAVAYEHGLLP